MLQNSDAEKKVIRRIAVFCGSSRGTERIFEEQAYELGKTLAVQNIELVYGGANVGLMGTVANGVMENGGKAIGVLPAFLKKVEIANLNLTELVMVDTMHQRKAKMNYKYEILIKSGTGQYYDYGNCDCLIKKCETPFLPRIGETIQINFNKINENTEKKCIQYYKFLVRDIQYWINEDKNGIYVYVIPIDGYKC